MMHAAAALGSILGTLVTGYLLIQYLGTRIVLLATAAGLFVLAVPFLRGSALALRLGLVSATILIGIATYLRDGFANPCERESNYFCIRVQEEADERSPDTVRSLVLDHLLHGTNHRDFPQLLLAPYVHLVDELMLHHFGTERLNQARVFFAGGGAYTQPRAVRAMYPQARVTVSELDPVVTETARARLFVDTAGMSIHHVDARVALQASEEAYDIIVTDVFHDISVPHHLVTQQFALLVKNRLTADGLYLVNVVDALPNPNLVKSLLKTLRSVFQRVDVWMHRLPTAPARVTFVISASEDHVAPEIITAQRGMARRWLRVNEPILNTGLPLQSLPLLTDDYVPVERLMAGLFLTELGR
jgi:spermidine synthase